MISLKQLRYLDAVARHGHFGRAAADCAVTQPALSMQIAALETALGITLIERRGRGVLLTETGREIAERAALVLHGVDAIASYARAMQGPLAAPLRLGVIPTIAPYVLPPLLPLLRDRYPSLDLRLRETFTHQLLADLSDGKLDVLLLALPLEGTDIETEPVADDRFLLAVPKGWKTGQRYRATPELIRNDRLLLLEEGHCLRDQAMAFCKVRSFHGIDTFGATSLSTIVQMVANGMGLTLLPEISLGVEATGGGVKLLRFAEPEPYRTLGLAWRSSSPRKKDFQLLARLIAESIACQRQRHVRNPERGNPEKP